MNHSSSCPTFKLEYAQLSDLGMRRMNNQDSVAVVVTDDAATWASRGHLLMVADGMGAHAAGELASKLAVDNIPHSYFKLRGLYPPAALRQAVRDANSLIHAKGQSSIGFQGMGTTCSCLVLLPQGALVAHIGDSRVYRLRGQHLSQLTFDHSLVWEMAAAGHMAEEDVPSCIPKNVITRSLGPHESVNLDLEGPYDVAPGDVFLICSDGLTGQIPDAELGAMLHCLTPEEAVQTFVDVANLRGGPDNISVVVARIVGEDSPPSKEVPASRTGTPPASQSMMLGVAAVACGLAAAYFLFTHNLVAAAAAAAGTVAALMLRIIGRQDRVELPGPSDSIGGPYGNGPYRDTHSDANGKVVNSLAEIVDKLRNLPENDGFVIDWQPLEDVSAAAKAAADSGDSSAAIRRYSETIRAFMAQLRQQRAFDETDPEIRLA